MTKDWASRLASETTEQLKQRARNAMKIIDAYPNTEKAAGAEAMMGHVDEELARRSLPGNIESFMDRFPGGFSDPAYLKEERKDKLDASDLCKELLSVEVFEKGDFEAVVAAVKRVVNATNLIQGSFEKPKLFDKISSPDVAPAFAQALGQLLYGKGDGPDRLEKFSSYMHTIGLRKWTYGTYFLFLANRGEYMFVKPEGVKKALEICGYAAEYESTPSAEIYYQILGFARWIEKRLKADGRPELVPRDMIDIQSFIWVMAPTGKFSK